MQKKKLPKFQFTQEGYEKVEEEYAQLQKNRKGAVEELNIAREMGDRSENAAYKTARANLSRIDSRLRYLKMLLDRGEVVEKRADGVIGLGSKVELESRGKAFSYVLVGSHESDVFKGKLSASSPLGKALIGKNKGDKVIINTENGEIIYNINNVDNIRGDS